MKRRSFLGMLGAAVGVTTVPVVASAQCRIEPKFDVRPPVLRSEKGAPLTTEEMDSNFRDLHARLSRLENREFCDA
jgi:hypothetical protein